MKANRFRICGLIGLLYMNTAGALEHIITQGENQFSELFVKVESNDVIKFVNLDSVDHKLTFTYKAQKETFSELSPGQAQVVEFSRSGVYDIQCDIHPQMRITVFVPHLNDIKRNRQKYVF